MKKLFIIMSAFCFIGGTATYAVTPEDNALEIQKLKKQVQRLQNTLMVEGNVDALRSYLDQKGLSFTLSTDVKFSQEEIRDLLTTTRTCLERAIQNYPGHGLSFSKISYSGWSDSHWVSYSQKSSDVSIIMDTSSREIPSAQECYDRVVSEGIYKKD